MSERNGQSIETPHQLAERYRQELRELVDDGEISAAVAERVTDDLFEAATAGEPPTVRWSVWCAYVENAERNLPPGRVIDFARVWRHTPRS